MTREEFIIFIKSLGFKKDISRISSVYEYYTYKHFCKIAIYVIPNIFIVLKILIKDMDLILQSMILIILRRYSVMKLDLLN